MRRLWWIAFLAAFEASAEVDSKCLERWNRAVTLANVAQQCKLGDAAAAAKLRQVEEASLQCAIAHASAAEKSEIAESASKGKAKVRSELARMPCGEEARKYFDKGVAALR